MNTSNKAIINFKKIDLIIISIFALLIIIPTVAAWTKVSCDYPSGASACDSGNVAGDVATCSLANLCAEEGTIVCRSQTSEGTSANINTKIINWDGDSASCSCNLGAGRWALGGDIAQTTCCGDDANENYVGPSDIKSCDGTTACCASASDSVRNGICVSSCYMWENLFEDEITGSYKGDTVRMVLKNTGLPDDSNVLFEIKEGADNIRTGADAITGTSVNETVIAAWTITQGDLAKTSSLENFKFTTNFSGEISDNLNITDEYNNILTTLELTSPSCGSYFNASMTPVGITIDAEDGDDVINGTLSINGLQIATFGNEGITIDYLFSEGGEYKLIAETTNMRGRNARKISNIMVIDTTTDGEYVAACITEPEDYSDIPTSYVEFNASTSLGVRYDATSGTTTEISLSDLIFDWSFSDGRTNPYTSGTDKLSYEFFKNFYTVGSNWAKLQVSIF